MASAVVEPSYEDLLNEAKKEPLSIYWDFRTYKKVKENERYYVTNEIGLRNGVSIALIDFQTQEKVWLSCADLLIDFKFDSESLQFVGFEKGKIFSDYETSDAKGIVRLMCVENEDVKGDGELVTLEFKVIGDKSAKTEVSVALEDNSLCNYDEELIPAKGEKGTVKIKK